MAIGWFTVLQLVPWTDVMRNAPKLAEGAKKLWNSVAGKPPVPEFTPPGAPASAASGPVALAALEGRIAELGRAVSDQHAGMLASSELIKALADQNAQLVARIESNRVRVRWLGAATTVALIVAVLALWLAVSPR